MAFATPEQVADALGRDLTSQEEAAAPTLLEEATDLITGYLGCTPDPVPGAVSRVCARMVARVFGQAAASVPVGASQVQQSAGPFSRSTSFSTGASNGSPWLAAADKTSLRLYRCNGGMRSVSGQSDHTGRYREYV